MSVSEQEIEKFKITVLEECYQLEQQGASRDEIADALRSMFEKYRNDTVDNNPYIQAIYE